MRASTILPMNLTEEVFDIEGYNAPEDKNPKIIVSKTSQMEDGDEMEYLDADEKKNVYRGFDVPYEREELFKENIDNVESIEFTPEFLYLPQVMRIYPDDYHIIFKTLLNLSAYETSKQGGIDEQGDSLMGSANEEA